MRFVICYELIFELLTSEKKYDKLLIKIISYNNLILYLEGNTMGMGWRECNYTVEESRRKCFCGAGEIITYVKYEEESDFPPFYRDESTYDICNCNNPQCPDYQKHH